MPFPPMVPGGTGRDRDFPGRRSREWPERRRVTQATPRRQAPAVLQALARMTAGSLDGRASQRLHIFGRRFDGSMSAVSSGSPQGNAEVREPEASREPGQPQQPANAPRQGAAPDHAANQADFGANEWLVEELYQRYLADPGSVDRAWWSFFADYQPTLPNGTGPQPVIGLRRPAPAAAPAPAPAPAQAPQSPPSGQAPQAQQAAPPAPAPQAPPAPPAAAPPPPAGCVLSP